MIGKTVSHYRIVEKISGAAWVWSIKLRTAPAALSPLSSFLNTV
jgi:hypothetical protein